MKGIYVRMLEDWKAYCLMSGIALIEEIKKPFKHTQPRTYRQTVKRYRRFQSMIFKQKNPSITRKWWKITRNWEGELDLHLLGDSFKEGPRYNEKEQKYNIIFSPEWLYQILKITGKLPSAHTFRICKERLIAAIKRRSGYKYLFPENEVEKILFKKSLYNLLFEDKYLAAGAFIISFDLECRGIYSSDIKLTMSDKYKDFLEFMLRVAKKFGWSRNEKLLEVNIDSSLRKGIKASPQKQFGIKTSKIEEIYNLAGPLVDETKNKFLEFHINRIRSKSIKPRKAKEKIISYLSSVKRCKTRDLIIPSGVRRDSVLYHLHNLEKEGFIERIRKGKGYIWYVR